MNTSENERKTDGLETSVVKQDVASHLASDEANMKEHFLNHECMAEEQIPSENGDAFLIEDHNPNTYASNDDYGKNLIEILKAGGPGLHSTNDVKNLLEFLNEGGWLILFKWLEESKTTEDITFQARLLDLYRMMPVTVQMLKQNHCAKLIKQLIKSPNEEHKSKKVKHAGKHKVDESERSNDIDDDSQSPTGLEKPSPRKRSNSGSTDSLLSDVKITVKILPPRQSNPVPESAPCQGFMNALSSVNTVPERKRKRRRPSVVKNINNNVGDSISTSIDDEDDDEKTDIEENVTQEKVVPPQIKKTVTWAKEGALCVYHHFPMDETERVNVNHMVDFNEIRRHEIEMEHRMFQNSRRNLHIDQLIDQWRRPSFITGVSYLVEPGCNSTERKTQMTREQNVLQALYFNKRLLTDHPAEPDPEFVEATEPKNIPLSDVTGTNSEVLYEHTSNVTFSCTTSSSPSSSISSTPSSSSADLIVTSNNIDVQVSAQVTQSHSSISPAMPWGAVYTVPPPPVLAPVLDPQVLQTIMPPIIAPMYPPGFIPAPGFGHPPPHLPPPEFLRGYRPPIHHMSLAMPIPSFISPTTPPCAHFLAGNCKFGQNCRFFHPPTPESPTTTAQPSSTKT